MSAPTERQRHAQHRVHELLAELAEVVGPAQDGRAEFEPGDAPVGPVMLSEWVVVTCWIDQAGGCFTATTPSAGMLQHHGVGLLYTAIHDQLAEGE